MVGSQLLRVVDGDEIIYTRREASKHATYVTEIDIGTDPFTLTMSRSTGEEIGRTRIPEMCLSAFKESVYDGHDYDPGDGNPQAAIWRARSALWSLMFDPAVRDNPVVETEVEEIERRLCLVKQAIGGDI